MSFHQMLTIARVERQRWWRKPFVPMLLFIPFMIGGIFLTREDITDTAGQGPQAELFSNTFYVGGFLLAMMLILSIFTALLFAESIPEDSQLRVSPLLESLPLAPGAYVLGKLAGTLAAIFQLYVLMFLMILAIAYLIVGPMLLPELLLLGALASVPPLITAALSLLLSAQLRTRRRALVVGTFVVVGIFAHMISAMLVPQGVMHRTALLPAFLGLLELILRPLVAQLGTPSGPTPFTQTWGNLAFSGLIQLSFVALLALAVIGWRRRTS